MVSIEAWQAPFNAERDEWRPDPAWPLPALPPGWDAHPDWRRHLDYLSRANELWARAYAQWITWKSGDLRLKDLIDAALRSSDDYVRLEHWPHDEFLPVAAAIDIMAENTGWLRRLESQ